MELMNYVKQAKKAVNDAYCSYEDALFKKNAAVDRVKAKAATSKTYTNIEASEDSDRAIAEFDKACNALQETYRKAISDIRLSFTNAVYEFYKPDGERINDADAKLLNCGIELSKGEVVDMVIRNSDNCTMLRLIGNYIAKLKITDLPKSIEMALYRATKSGEHEIKVFDTFVHLSSMGLGHQDGSYLYVWKRLDEYEEDAKTAFEKVKPYISPEDLKAVEAAEIARKSNYQPLT